MLALLDNDGTVPNSGAQFIRGFTMNVELKRRIEAAGHGFKEFYESKVLGKYNKAKVEVEETKDEEFNEKKVHEWEKKKHEHKKKLSPSQMQNYYYILGLDEQGMAASDKEIRGAYRKMALKHHPDKNRANKVAAEGEDDSPEARREKPITIETDPYWLEVQKAYDTLIDPEKKRKYDSSLEFDDEIPSEPVNRSKFFDIFAPVFRRNAMWSTKKPVPDVGDDKTSWEQVEKFYDFWFKFESWRDFSAEEEYNLEEAEDRFERRFMERENKKKKAAATKEENARLMKLVEMAYENDPRVLLRRKEEEDEKKRRKEEQKEKKKQAIADRERQYEEEKLKKQQDEDEVKRREEEERNKVKLRLKNAQKEFVTLMAEKVKSPEHDKFWAQEYVKTLQVEDLESANQRVKDGPEGAKSKDLLKQIVVEFEAEKERRKEEEKKKDAAAKKISSGEWSPEEISLFYKGVQKFPVGTKNRWEVLSQYIKTRTPDEIIAKAKELANNNSLRTLEKPQVKKPVIPGTEPQEEEKKATPAQPKQAPAPSPAKDATPAIDPSGWSQEQQAALEGGLRKHPASMETKERWAKIAEGVEGKTVKECVDRFKELRAMVKNKGA